MALGLSHYINNCNEHEFIHIPESASILGSGLYDPYASVKELPVREVFISEFFISKHPTTYKQFAQFLLENNIPFPSSWGKINNTFPEKLDEFTNYPVTNISWEIAKNIVAGYQKKLMQM